MHMHMIVSWTLAHIAPASSASIRLAWYWGLSDYHKLSLDAGVSYGRVVQVAGRTNDAAGDGTTTASVLAREMIHYGLQVLVIA